MVACVHPQPPITVYGIPGRYASALYSAAAKAKALDKVEKELTEVRWNFSAARSDCHKHAPALDAHGLGCALPGAPPCPAQLRHISRVSVHGSAVTSLHRHIDTCVMLMRVFSDSECSACLFRWHLNTAGCA